MKTSLLILQVSSRSLRYKCRFNFYEIELFFQVDTIQLMFPSVIFCSKYPRCQHFIPAFSPHVWEDCTGKIKFITSTEVTLLHLTTFFIIFRRQYMELELGWDFSRGTSDCCQMTWRPSSPPFSPWFLDCLTASTTKLVIFYFFPQLYMELNCVYFTIYSFNH